MSLEDVGWVRDILQMLHPTQKLFFNICCLWMLMGKKKKRSLTCCSPPHSRCCCDGPRWKAPHPEPWSKPHSENSRGGTSSREPAGSENPQQSLSHFRIFKNIYGLVFFFEWCVFLQTTVLIVIGNRIFFFLCYISPLSPPIFAFIFFLLFCLCKNILRSTHVKFKSRICFPVELIKHWVLK